MRTQGSTKVYTSLIHKSECGLELSRSTHSNNKMEEEQKTKPRKLAKLANFHDKNYKKLLLIPLILLVFCFVYMASFYSQNNDIIRKDISLKGGTSITINDNINTEELEQALSEKLEEMNTREIYDLITREQIAIIIETTSPYEKVKLILEDYLEY